MRNVVVFGDAQADRSPCGTGTSAKLATLHKWGELGVGEEFIYESFMGTRFKGVIKEETKIGYSNGYRYSLPDRCCYIYYRWRRSVKIRFPYRIIIHQIIFTRENLFLGSLLFYYSSMENVS